MVGWTGIGVRMAARSAALLFLHAAPCEAAVPKGELQATSSATISIRLSVAAKYGLRPAGLFAGGTIRSPGGSGGYCIASNAAPLSLPVLLVRPDRADSGPATQGADGSQPSAVPVTMCDAANAPPAGLASSGLASDAGLLLIRPE